MRKLLYITIGFAASCALAAYGDSSVIWILGLIFFALFAISLFLVRKWNKFKVAASLLLGLWLGACWFAGYDSFLLEPARALDGKAVLATITLSDYSEESSYGISVNGDFQHQGRTYRVLIYLNDPAEFRPGDRISGYFRFRYTSVGGEREVNYRQGEGIFLFASQIGRYTWEKCDQVPLRYYGAYLRHLISSKIDELFDSDAAGFAKALVLGDRSDLDYEISTNFKISGISHIVAVSGLHVSMVFALVYLLSIRRRWLLFLLGIPSLVLFSAIAGFTPSVTRACIMQAMMILAMLTNREYDPPTALAFSALVMLCVNPMVITSVSFQLTVSCMIGIFLFYRRIHAWLLQRKWMGNVQGNGILSRIKRGFAASICVSISATLCTTPFVAFYFGTVSLIGVVTNLLAVWLVTYIFYGIALACAISTFSGIIAAFLTVLTTGAIRFLLWIVEVLAEFPLAAVYTKSIYVVCWLIFAYVMLGAFLLMKKKPLVLTSGLVTMGLCLSLLLSWVEPMLDDTRITLIDVGQGQCVLIQSQGRSYLVDCGGYSETSSADAAAESLLSQGISRLDGIIVTHYDEDHAGGIANLLTRISADRVYLPNLSDEDGVGCEIRKLVNGAAVLVAEDLQLTFGSSNMQLFAPEMVEMGNESSICVLFSGKNCDILITGDRGTLGEALLMQRVVLPKLDLLIAGHHGSGGSTGEKLLAKTEPDYVFISVGENNRYGHPSDELLARLAKYGCIVYRTDQNGTILFRG